MKKILILFLLISATVSAQEKLDKLLIKWNKKNVQFDNPAMNNFFERNERDSLLVKNH